MRYLALLLLAVPSAFAHQCHDALPLNQYKGGTQLLGWWEETAAGKKVHLLITPDSLYWDGVSGHLDELVQPEEVPAADHETVPQENPSKLPPYFASSPELVFAGLLGVYDETATDDYLCMVGGLSNGNFIWMDFMFALEGDLLQLRFHPGEPDEQVEFYTRAPLPATAVMPATWGAAKGKIP